VLCCAVLCCAVLCCAVLCCAVLCCAVLCCCPAGQHRQQVTDVDKAMEAGYRAQNPFLDIIAELRAFATSVRVPRSGNTPGMRFRPSIAVTLDLAPTGKGTKNARDGTLKITVRH